MAIFQQAGTSAIGHLTQPNVAPVTTDWLQLWDIWYFCHLEDIEVDITGKHVYEWDYVYWDIKCHLQEGCGGLYYLVIPGW